MNRAISLWIFVAAALVYLVISCFTTIDRSTWRLLSNGLMLLYMALVGYTARAHTPGAWRFGLRFGIFAYGIYTLCVLLLAFAIPDALQQFPFEYYDFELSNERSLSAYTHSAEGIQETLGTAAAEYLLMIAVAGIAAEVGVWIDRLILSKFR